MLYINGQLIDSYKDVSGVGGEPEDLCLDLPMHILFDKKNAEVWQGILEDEDVEKLQEVFRIDLAKYGEKKVRVFFQVMGQKPKG